MPVHTKVKFFESLDLVPKTPTPDGTSVEEQMNTFMNTLAVSAVHSTGLVGYTKVVGGQARAYVCGRVEYEA